MPNSSEGVRRLSIFAGSISSILWFICALFEIDYSSLNTWPARIIIFGGLVPSFFIPFALVRAVAWVKQGFTKE
jgi:hypothetical protein